MSENVMSSGIMVPLSKKIPSDEREDLTEDLYEQGSNVSINYEGTLAYTDDGGDEYGIHFGSMPAFEGETMFQDLEQYHIHVEKDKARPYRCLWYNGADSDMNMLKLEDFLALTRQTG